MDLRKQNNRPEWTASDEKFFWSLAHPSFMTTKESSQSLMNYCLIGLPHIRFPMGGQGCLTTEK